MELWNYGITELWNYGIMELWKRKPAIIELKKWAQKIQYFYRLLTKCCDKSNQVLVQTETMVL